jgi:glycosyltransferase involved in cell wall biosynthesis
MKLVLFGDGESPHLLEWARALGAHRDIELHAASSRRFLPGFDAVVPAARRLALDTSPRHGGGNIGVLVTLPRLTRWLRGVAPDWIHAHYLTSHGTLAWLAQRVGGVRARLAASAWGSDVLVTPERSVPARALLRRVLAASALATSDSQHMAQRMREFGARDVMVFPSGLREMPAAIDEAIKQPWLFYANRALEPLYAPRRVLDLFAHVAARHGDARLVVANDGSLRTALEAQASALGLASRVSFVGRLDADAQVAHYRRSRWFLSLPHSDSMSVSLLEAMAHGCVPIVSDLPANRELVRHGENGFVIEAVHDDAAAMLEALARRAADAARSNREWVEAHARFDVSVAAFVERLRAIDSPGMSNRGNDNRGNDGRAEGNRTNAPAR